MAKGLSNKVSERYGRALFNLALENKKVDKVEKDLDAINETIETNQTFNDFLNNPVISKNQQLKAISALMEKLPYQNETKNFVKLVAKNGRLSNLESIIRFYKNQKVLHNGDVPIKIISAKKLKAQQVSQIDETLKKTIQGNIIIDREVDQSIMGGLIIQLGSTMIDGSIKSKLDKLQRQLKSIE